MLCAVCCVLCAVCCVLCTLPGRLGVCVFMRAGVGVWGVGGAHMDINSHAQASLHKSTSARATPLFLVCSVVGVCMPWLQACLRKTAGTGSGGDPGSSSGSGRELELDLELELASVAEQLRASCAGSDQTVLASCACATTEWRAVAAASEPIRKPVATADATSAAGCCS